MILADFFAENPHIMLAFSGGVDSAFLLYSAKQNNGKPIPVFVKTPFQPAFELEDARRLCRELDIPLTVIELDVLSNEIIANNPENRCYHCKTLIFTALWNKAKELGIKTLIDGTNASDICEERPGMLALSELSVRSPLRECGLTKDMIRKLSKKAGLFTWDKPAYACLATRIPSNERITADLLLRIEKAEETLMMMGYFNFRLRYYHGAARLQIPENQMEKVLSERISIISALKPHFFAILLDLEGR